MFSVKREKRQNFQTSELSIIISEERTLSKTGVEKAVAAEIECAAKCVFVVKT